MKTEPTLRCDSVRSSMVSAPVSLLHSTRMLVGFLLGCEVRFSFEGLVNCVRLVAKTVLCRGCLRRSPASRRLCKLWLFVVSERKEASCAVSTEKGGGETHRSRVREQAHTRQHERRCESFRSPWRTRSRGKKKINTAHEMSPRRSPACWRENASFFLLRVGAFIDGRLPWSCSWW